MGEKTKKRIFAIDYGTKRIGLAKSDPFGNFAQPVGTFPPEKITTVLSSLLLNDPAAKIIVGYPLNSDGTKNRMTGVVDCFIEELKKAFPDLPVETIDEHGSSRHAGKLLVESGLSRRKRQQKGRLDCAAACLLLQTYLESSG
ncbi:MULTISPECIES: Holliday junction resolvase RuvX [unclassified Prosthecochloris]|uniref:Holliday junction resolvase RuvX n=1 Tax=unclassified Prosthecochloris TaxID=2632826 RepID=UPI00223E3175|nr:MULTISPECIES: Holliday junction resolvase RuvX [unclassified Prosthecochloris]UZJ37802.1 Holliday junction resolvase RuvX [Prosthecochloris sp. SCSIO W1103]UZJ41612.1 Holliday junction resolvase RuvX [Prosthecochloris sp. SCSIO W1101]